MMLAKIDSSSLLGIDAYIVEVEIDVSFGIRAFSIVGLPDTAVQEARERVRLAIRNSNLEFPTQRITINLAPADIKKEGPSFDLPIALGILAATEQVNKESLDKFIFVGELSLDGSIRKVDGVLPVAITCKKKGKEGIVLPEINAKEASLVEGIKVFAMKNLSETVEFLNNNLAKEPYSAEVKDTSLDNPNYSIDFTDVKGQEHAKRALEIAAAGAHNVLMVGPPGAGKTMLARRLSTILPEMSWEEAIETTKLFSVTGLLPKEFPLLTTRPFRSPHHTISHAGLVGGGTYPKPGEVSLSHHGVLFLDELPEFHRDVLEVLRQPLEEGVVTISRAATSVSYPASFMLVAAMNPCPCGFFGDPIKQCNCTPPQIQRYLRKISGPLLDRIDIHIEVPRLNYEKLTDKGGSKEVSSQIRHRVKRARLIQQKRFGKRGFYCNAQMQSRDVREFCLIPSSAKDLLRQAVNQLGLSARAYDRVLKLSRTIADLEEREEIETPDIAEAIQYRSLDRKLWV